MTASFKDKQLGPLLWQFFAFTFAFSTFFSGFALYAERRFTRNGMPFGPKEVERLLLNPDIIRNRAKLEAAVANARATLQVQEKYGSLDSFLWRIVEGKPVVNRWSNYREAPAKSSVSEILARECKKEGFKFIGPTVAYAFMQAVGMVNDHEVTCFRYKEIGIATNK